MCHSCVIFCVLHTPSVRVVSQQESGDYARGCKVFSWSQSWWILESNLCWRNWRDWRLRRACFFRHVFVCCLAIWEGLGWLQKIVKGIYWYTNHPGLFLKLLPLLDLRVCNKWPDFFLIDCIMDLAYPGARPQTWASPPSKENKHHAFFCWGGRTWWICVDLKGRHVCWDIPKKSKNDWTITPQDLFFFLARGGGGEGLHTLIQQSRDHELWSLGPAHQKGPYIRLILGWLTQRGSEFRSTSNTYIAWNESFTK